MEYKTIAFTEMQVLNKLVDIVSVIGSVNNGTNLYDVDMFIDDVTKFEWPGRLDSDAQVEFNCGLMAFCKLDTYFGLAGEVILFTELSDWAARYFNPEM